MLRVMDQQHLLAISRRQSVPEACRSDVLVERGDGEVLRATAENANVKVSETSISRLVERCNKDDELAARIGARPDIPHQLFQKLLEVASDAVRSRFVATSFACTGRV